MNPHHLQGRSEDELRWFTRRSFVQAAATWTALGGFAAAQAQQRSNIIELKGEALANGKPLRPKQSIVTGDKIQTGPGSELVFVVGNSSFLVRQNSSLTVERGATLFTVSLLRLASGAVASVWGKGGNRQIVTPTLTAGIRGTGVYTEIFADQSNRSYFCNCYGVVELRTGSEKTTSRSDYHQAFWSDVGDNDERRLTPAKAINHTDEELERLAGLVRQRTAWQISGKKGHKSGEEY